MGYQQIHLFTLFTFFVFTSVSGLADDKMIALRWAGVKIPTQPLLELADKDVNEIIQHIRKTYKLKVLVVPFVYKDATPNKKLTIKNEPEDVKDPKLLQYFEWMMRDSEATGSFVEPYSIIYEQKGYPYRKYLFDQSVIMLNLSADREVVIHEFIHYLIYKAHDKKPIKYKGRLLAQPSYLVIQEVKLIDALIPKKKTFFEGIKDGTANKDDFIAMVEALVPTLEVIHERSMLKYAEEIDVTRTVHQLRKTLKLTQMQSVSSFRYLSDQFSLQNDLIKGNWNAPETRYMRANLDALPKELREKAQKRIDDLKTEIEKRDEELEFLKKAHQELLDEIGCGDDMSMSYDCEYMDPSLSFIHFLSAEEAFESQLESSNRLMWDYHDACDFGYCWAGEQY